MSGEDIKGLFQKYSPQIKLTKSTSDGKKGREKWNFARIGRFQFGAHWRMECWLWCWWSLSSGHSIPNMERALVKTVSVAPGQRSTAYLGVPLYTRLWPLRVFGKHTTSFCHEPPRLDASPVSGRLFWSTLTESTVCKCHPCINKNLKEAEECWFGDLFPLAKVFSPKDKSKTNPMKT